jgi:hypothetical protein
VAKRKELFMKSKDDKEVRRPDELNSFEYLKTHLYDGAINGKYEREFREVRKFVFEMKRFSSFVKFLKETGKRKNIKTKEEVVTSLIRIYQCRKELRPSIGVVMVMVLWRRLVRLAPGEWFDDAYYQLFVEAETFDTNEPEVIDRLMETIRKKMHGGKCSTAAMDEADDYDDVEINEESEEEIKKDSRRFSSFCDDWWEEYARNGDEECEDEKPEYLNPNS